MLACVERTAETHDCILSARCFAVAFLAQDQERLARRFASAIPAAEKFEGTAFREERTGAPVLEAALAWVDCTLRQHFDGGDHTIFVGEVVAGDAHEGQPLVFYRGGYGGLTP